MDSSYNNGVDYIYDYLLDNYEVNLYQEEYDELVKDIYLKLRRDKCSTRDIIKGKYDNKIKSIYHRMMMKSKSVQSEKTVKKVKHQPKKRNMQKTIVALMIVAVLAGVGAGSIGVVNKIDNEQAKEMVIDTYEVSYPYIFTSKADEFKDSVENVLDFYEHTSNISDDNYSHLGFYLAYEHVMQDKLAVMDDMLRQVSSVASHREGFEFLGEELGKYSCYLDFVMDRLKYMGCEEIKDEKYASALRAYEIAMNNHPNEKPYEFLTKQEQNIIKNDIMDMYKDYSEDYHIELGKYLESKGISK